MEKICEFCGVTFYTNVDCKRFCRRSCKQLASANGQACKSLQGFASIPLRVIKGDLSHTLKKVQRSQYFLNFCLSLFWTARNFNEEEKHEFVNLIGKHFAGSLDIDASFKELVERAVLYKKEYSTKAYSFVPEPKDWFDKGYIYGLSKTLPLYANIQKQREQLVGFKLGLKVLAEGVLKYSETRNVLDITSYRNKLIATGDPDLLQIYLIAVMQIQFLSH